MNALTFACGQRGPVTVALARDIGRALDDVASIARDSQLSAHGIVTACKFAVLNADKWVACRLFNE